MATATDNSTSTQDPKTSPIDWLVNIKDQLEAIEGQHWMNLDKETRFKIGDTCANAGGVIDAFLSGLVIEHQPEKTESGHTDDRPGYDINELSELILDVKTVGDLLTAASTSPDQLLDNTVCNAGWFIERSATKVQKMLNGGAS